MLVLSGREAEALEVLARILALEPGNHEALNNRGMLLGHLGRSAEALDDLARAMTAKPDFADPHFNTGRIFEQFGQFAPARHAYETALKLAPERGAFYHALAECGYRAVDPERLRVMEEMLEHTPHPGTSDRTSLHFGLAKAYEDYERYERSFRHLAAGNALKRKTLRYDETAALELFERTAAAFGEEVTHRRPSLPPSGTDAPIFIVGMPRSGSSLVEQILSSHPRIFAAGEAGFLDMAIDGFDGLPGLSGNPEQLASLSQRDLETIGARYLGNMRSMAPGGQRPVDKLPINFRHLGLIQAALPGARIIHIYRDPLDTCLSCFFRLFSNGNQPYAYDLAELGRYYRGYERLMAHWRRVLPGGVMLDLRYEDLVEDLPAQVRRILAHCELEWHPDCVEFHRSHRQVHTDSRVHRPLYETSIGRWRNYEAFLGPLRQRYDRVR
ncbi:hypothetical protein LMIY3S_04077 [Labrys miyagiensis]